MINSLSLPELHSSNNSVKRDDSDDHFIKSKKDHWSVKKNFHINPMFDLVSNVFY